MDSDDLVILTDETGGHGSPSTPLAQGHTPPDARDEALFALPAAVRRRRIAVAARRVAHGAREYMGRRVAVLRAAHDTRQRGDLAAARRRYKATLAEWRDACLAAREAARELRRLRAIIAIGGTT